MKKRPTKSYKWAYLPFVFSSAAILASSVLTAAPTSQRYQDAKQVSSINHEYVGGNTQLGVSVTDQGDIGVELNQVISESQDSSTSVGLWGDYDLDGNDKGLQGRGAQVNHNWVSRDNAGRATHVNKASLAYDRSGSGHEKATIGYGQESESNFWDVHASKGLSGRKSVGTNISDKAYAYGAGAGVGTFYKDSNIRIRAGLDHEWGDDVGAGESTAKNTTISAGVEKFFQGTPHSLGLDIAASKKSGGLENNSSDANVNGRVTYRYDFGGASIYQPDRRYKRVRVEVPGQAVAAQYKTVPVYTKKTVKKPYKQLVKSTMALEGQTFFKRNSYKLIPSAQTRLKQIASEIRKNGYKGAIRITGNTCDLGDPAYDQRLSEKRANEVRNFLIRNGFNPDHLIARGLGKGHPKYPNTPDQGFKNRRVDIEYVSERKVYKTGYRTETQNVRTGSKQVMISSGKPGTPRVIWKTQVIPTPPAWVKRALHNNIKHDRNVSTYTSTDKVTAPANVAPIARNDDRTISCSTTPVTIDVLANDTDADNDVLTITNVGNGQYGTTAIVGNKVVYTPNGLGCGKTDSFEYTITDNNGHTTTATVNINSANTNPDAVNDSGTTPTNTAITVNVLGNDTDPENDNLTITGFDSTSANGGTVTQGSNGQLIYTPATGFSGTDTFNYTISDGHGGTDTATVTITVDAPANSNPDAVNDSGTTPMNTAITVNVLGNDTDPENDNLTITGFDATSANGGTVTQGSNGQLIYTPATGFSGTDTFNYTISDGKGGTDTATVTITVEAAANSNPDAVNDSSTTPGNTAVTIDVLGNDTDPDGDNLTITGFDATSANGGTITQGSNGQLIYTPATGFSGTDTFNYTISDGKGGTDTATVTITVGACDVCTVAETDEISTTVDTPVTINVLANDTGVGIRITSVDIPDHGTASIVGNSIKYIPNPGFKGTDSFWYDIVDDKGYATSALIVVYIEQL